jgi:hypothetical protein
MNNRPKLTAMVESARRVAATVPAWMLDAKRISEDGGDRPKPKANSGAELENATKPA